MIRLLKSVPPGRTFLVLAALIWLASGIYTVARDEEGVVILLGRPWQKHARPGIHFAPPWPFGRTTVVRTTSTYQMSVGFRIAEAVQGRLPDPSETEFLTGDTNIIALEMILQYIIDEPYRFLYGVEDGHFLVRRAAEATVTSILAHSRVDDVLTTGRASLLEEVRLGTQEKLRDCDAGITVVSATLKRIEPPGDVLDAFQDVQNAKADRERAINEASGYANEILPRARGEANALIAAARGAKNARIEAARGDADRIAKVTAEYAAAPVGMKERLFLEVAEKVLPRAQIYVFDASSSGKPMGVKLIE